MIRATSPPAAAPLTLFLCGDVMTGRGIDQVLAHPGRPILYEDYVTDARDYVRLTERASGPIARPVPPEYIWGEALAAIDRASPQLRIVNLETAVTTAEDAWPGKGIHYRMHPANVGCLTAAKLDACVLANNHVLDWGYDGLAETVHVLRAAGMSTAGAGADSDQAAAPAIFDLPAGGRVLLVAAASVSSGVPRGWGGRARRLPACRAVAALRGRPGRAGGGRAPSRRHRDRVAALGRQLGLRGRR